MAIDKNAVIVADGYNRIDGKRAYESQLTKITIGAPLLEANRDAQIAMQLWRESPEAGTEISLEIPVHQVMDMMLILLRSMVHFKDAYRHPLLYDPEQPVIDRLGLQGDYARLSVCMENENINEDIKKLADALSSMGEITGERLRVLAGLMESMEY